MLRFLLVAISHISVIVPIFIAVSNNSNQPVNVTLSASVDPALLVVYSEPAFTSLDNNSSMWELSNLAAGSITYIQLYVQTPGEEYIGAPITGAVSMVVTDMNANVVDSDSQTFTGEFYCSFDPNDISVKPEGATDQHYIQNGTELEYLIRFQNTGNYPATDVVIECALDNHLDFSTLEIVSTSHAGQLNFNAETGMLEFVFHNIYLADSVSNEPESHGFLRFKVMPLNNLDEGTVISESAAIFFDLNQPVLTNTAFNTISDLYFGIDENLTSFQVYPNPADDRIQFNLSTFSGKMNIELLDATGRIVKQLTIVASERAEMNLNEIPAGVYHVKITNSEGQSYSEKVIIK
jgi:uncharacterized repeat protein (TIGR01451 family)